MILTGEAHHYKQAPPYSVKVALCSVLITLTVSLPPVYLFMGLMMMYLLLRTFHKMADLHGLTTFLQLPRCEEDLDDSREPIVNEASSTSDLTEKGASERLEPGSQPSYNTINKS